MNGAASMTTALPYLKQFDLSGQVALVTGSARGLGLCIARALAGSGARVLINGRNAQAVDATVAGLRADGLDAHPLVFDVSNDAALAQAFERIDREHGRLDICLLYTSPSPRDKRQSRMPSSA